MMELEQIERPLIAYSLCFDDVMKTLLSAEDIAYDKAFSFCFEFDYNQKKKSFSEAIKFPHGGFQKYKEIGIEVKKKEINDDNALNEVIDYIKSGQIVPIHYDGYYCPWDKLQKKLRWHNMHTVLAYFVDDKKKCFYVDDPFYKVQGKTVPFNAVGTASKFFFSVDTAHYINKTYAQLQEEGMAQFSQSSMFQHMEHFLEDFKFSIQRKNYSGIFDEAWVKTIENGYMTRHYLWLFYQSLYRETGDRKFGKTVMLLYEDLQAWKECVTQSHKGWRSREKEVRGELFVCAFMRVIDIEKQILSTLTGPEKKEEAFLYECVMPKAPQVYPISLANLFDARACKKSCHERSYADITGEGEYILPQRRCRTSVCFGKISYPVYFGESKDHIRCQKQKLYIERSFSYKGIAFLVCSEWGRSLFSAVFVGKRKKFYCDCILNDFTNPEENSIQIGRSFLLGKKKDIQFQKHIYLQSVYFAFPKEDEIQEIILPDCISVHLFSAVLIK